MKEQKLNHYMPGVDWPGLTCILGAKPDPMLTGHTPLPSSFNLSGPHLPYLCFGSSLDLPEDHCVARQWIPLLSAHFKVKSFFCNLCPSLTAFILYSLSLVVPAGKTQISLLLLHTLENSCHVPFWSSLLAVHPQFLQLFLVADYPTL